MKSITICDIPLPPTELSPNSRSHWRVKSKATKSQREVSFMLGQVAVRQLDDWKSYQFPWSEAVASVVWYRQRNAAIDRDNALAMLKSTFDGLTDAGLLTDDRGLVPLPIRFELDRLNPRVEVTLTQVIEGSCPMCGAVHTC